MMMTMPMEVVLQVEVAVEVLILAGKVAERRRRTK